MELELLNTQLRKGQVKVECSARSEEAALRATKTELEQAREKLQAIPKRSTDSLRLLREEVAKLEKEKRSLEQANHQKGLKVPCYGLLCTRYLLSYHLVVLRLPRTRLIPID